MQGRRLQTLARAGARSTVSRTPTYPQQLKHGAICLPRRWGGIVSATPRCFPHSAVSSRAFTCSSEDQQELRKAVRDYCEKEIQPLVHSMDQAQKLDPALLESLFNAGYLGCEIREEYGGAGMSFTDTLIVVEEIARIDPSVAILVDIQNTLVNKSLMEFGTTEQQERYLPKLATSHIGSFCLSESNSGSDAFSLKASAERDSNGWRLNGAKQWISNSKEAKLFLVFATVDPTKRHRGITAFLVDSDSAGLTVGNKYDKLGLRASSTCEVILDNVLVPDAQVLGEVGFGYKIAIGLLNQGRIGIAAQMLGLAQGAFDVSLPYIHERHQFGSAIADFQGMKFQYASLATDIEAARLMVYHAAELHEKGLPMPVEAAMAKVFASQTAEKVASKCVEFFGGYGFTSEYPVEKFFRDSKIGAIYEGTTNVLLDTIAKEIQKRYR